jgi:LL-diaminopimelate aminotransferase
MVQGDRIQPAERIGQLEPFFFAGLNARLADLRARGVDIIRLDIGSPDLPPANPIIQRLVDSAREATTHGYTAYGGVDQFRRAVSAYYQERFEVSLDPYREIEGLIGSKEGIFNLSQVLLNPGDLVLIPEPAYPTYLSGARVAGAQVYFLPLKEENQFLPDLEAVPAEIAGQAKLLWLNYPNNPTGAVADLDFFEKVIAFAEENTLVVAHDAPYMEIGFEGYRAPSILQVPGARAVAVEFNSLSKTYNMAGWRLGMAAGNPQVIGYLHAYKAQVDSSHFGPAQAAGAAALSGDQSWVARRNDIYQARRDMLLAGFEAVGIHARKPKAAIYIWARLPGDLDDTTFCEQLVEVTGVSLTPGSIYGESGRGYIRISLCTPVPLIDEAMARLAKWMERT